MEKRRRANKNAFVVNVCRCNWATRRTECQLIKYTDANLSFLFYENLPTMGCMNRRRENDYLRLIGN